MGLSGVLHTRRMKVFLISILYLSAVAALPHQDRQSGCQVPSWKGDGYCDDVNNVAGCAFDCGDCCGSNVNTQFCTVWQCKHTGGGGGGSRCATIPAWMKTAMTTTTGLERIIQGKQAPSPIPWQAHMRQGSPTGSFSFFCGGTILDATTILTAAHCYYGKNLNAGNFFIAAGAINDQDGSQQTAFVESIFLHESYNPPSLDNQQGTHDGDIAILKLKTPLTFNDKVGRACLPDATYNPIGITMGVASGWGLIGQGPDVTTSDLMWVTMPVVKRNSCVRPSSAWHPSIITNNMICAGDHDGGE